MGRVGSSIKITTGLYLLASQALPGLCEEHYSKSDFTSDIYNPQFSARQMEELEEKRMTTISRLFEEKKTSWWDVFDASEIGRERKIIASRYIAPNSEVLDVGCGRGFFSFACSRRASHVTALDLMNGKGRTGWWDEFLQTAALLKMTRRVSGIRAGAAHLPLEGGSFDAVTSVHAIRNFEEADELELFISESARVLKRGGRFVLAESDFESNGFRAYKEFYAMRIKIGWEMRIPPSREIVSILRKNGFSKIRQTILDLRLKYAPVYFPLGQAKLKGLAKRYSHAKRLLIEEGEQHPPVSVITALR